MTEHAETTAVASPEPSKVVDQAMQDRSKRRYMLVYLWTAIVVWVPIVLVQGGLFDPAEPSSFIQVFLAAILFLLICTPGYFLTRWILFTNRLWVKRFFFATSIVGVVIAFMRTVYSDAQGWEQGLNWIMLLLQLSMAVWFWRILSRDLAAQTDPSAPQPWA